MIDLLHSINPGLWIILAGLICTLLPVGQLRKLFVIAAPILAAFAIYTIYPFGGEDVIAGKVNFGGIELTTLRIDRLSVVWAYLFCLAGVINGIYGLHEKCRITDSSALIYTGAAVAGVMAGDMITLFVFWELTAISSVFLIWKGGDRAYAAGLRFFHDEVRYLRSRARFPRHGYSNLDWRSYDLFPCFLCGG